MGLLPRTTPRQISRNKKLKMNMLSKEPWFDKKTRWGVRPVIWQGFFASFLFVLVLVSLMLLTYLNPQYVWEFELVVIIVVLTFLITVGVTSPKPSKRSSIKE